MYVLPLPVIYLLICLSIYSPWYISSFSCFLYFYLGFGQAPGHEALTSYGLMEFLDMSKVFSLCYKNKTNKNNNN